MPLKTCARCRSVCRRRTARRPTGSGTGGLPVAPGGAQIHFERRLHAAKAGLCNFVAAGARCSLWSRKDAAACLSRPDVDEAPTPSRVY